MKMTANYHTHTKRCRHAVGTEREYIETAISRGLKVLGFADHTPQLFPCDDYYSNYRMYPEQAEDYFRTLDDLRREYRDDIEIKIGFEVEYFPEIFDKLLEFIKPFGCDYFILGQHYIDNEYDTHIYSGLARDDETLFKKYVDTLLTAIKTEKFSYIAHPDLFLFNGDDAIYEKHYRRLCEGARAAGIPLEINFLGLYENRHYPCDKFFRLAAEAGCDFVFGCDAHEPDAVANPVALQKAIDFAAKHGITPLERVELKSMQE